MKEKNDKQKEEYDVKKDCVFYQKNECYALAELVCKNKKCTFYKKNERYIEN